VGSNSGTAKESYFCLIILNTSIISPHILLYFNVCRLSSIKRSLYVDFLIEITSLVARF